MFKVEKLGDDEYHALIDRPHKSVYWKTPEPMTRDAIQKELLDRGEHVIDVHEILQMADRHGVGQMS